MANNPEIQVEIGANITGLQQGVAKAESTLQQVGNAANQAAPKVQKLANATQNYNSVGVDFARIIQDAPFGIIGVGNNITQLAGSFQVLKNQTGSTASALKAGFASIFSSGNLLVLGISAVTTALTLYSQSAQGTKGTVDDLKEAQDNYNESLKETDRLLGKDVFAQFLKEVGLIQQQNVGGRLIDVPTFESAAEVVDKLSGKIQTLRKGELELLAKFFQTQIAEALRVAENNTNKLGTALAQQDLPLYRGLLEKVNAQLAFYKTGTDSGATATNNLNNEAKELKRTFEEISGLPLIGSLRTGDVEALRERFKKIRPALEEGGLESLSPQQLLDQALQNAPGVNTQNTALLAVQNTTTALENQRLKVEELSEAFTGLGSLIGSAFKNPQFGTFIGQFAQFVTKVIAGAFAVSKANAIAGATQSSLFTGPAAAFTLPAFIAGAVGLVASAFAGLKGGGGGASGAGISGVGSGTSFAGSGATVGSFNRDLNLVGEFTIRGNDLVYVIDRSKERLGKG